MITGKRLAVWLCCRTNRASDRFVRASFYIQALPQTDNFRQVVAGVFGVMRNVSIPLGISIPEQPNIASTRWRTVADQKNKVYYFESTLSPDIFGSISKI